MQRVITTSLILFTLAGTSRAQRTSSQWFTVHVPPHSETTVSPAPMQMVYDGESDSFPTTSWTVRENSTNGVAVTFQSGSLQDLAKESSINVRLGLEVDSGKRGSIELLQAVDQTNFIIGDNQAIVGAVLSNAETATLRLTISMPDALKPPTPGSYSAIVAGTITAQ